MPPPSVNKDAHSGFETQRRHHQKSKTGLSVAPQKNMSFTNVKKSSNIPKVWKCQFPQLYAMFCGLATSTIEAWWKPENHYEFTSKQDCLPVGCIPPACWPYPPACTARGVPARGVSALGGVCMSAPRGGLLRGWGLGGSARGREGIPTCTEADTPPCGQNDRHV